MSIAKNKHINLKLKTPPFSQNMLIIDSLDLIKSYLNSRFGFKANERQTS